ncbi:MAG: type II toxin-antitoxin system RelE/ParE family toxin [Candidatus Gracilibacteria bacterium]|nr:type II toxin-antitoxin system RelE/ParE family toxin [Candidatus Gracilibacteria bacterium]MDQ7023432.1 type II toxin-antitoxin system RelE/ParE family toxin [Candidatus Gracilibacteria bacterium]
MVEKWRKEVEKTARNFGKKDLEEIIQDIINNDYSKYDFKYLSGYKNILRIRVGNYRIVFKEVKLGDNKIILFGKRGDVYKSLKNLNI